MDNWHCYGIHQILECMLWKEPALPSLLQPVLCWVPLGHWRQRQPLDTLPVLRMRRSRPGLGRLISSEWFMAVGSSSSKKHGISKSSSEPYQENSPKISGTSVPIAAEVTTPKLSSLRLLVLLFPTNHTATALSTLSILWIRPRPFIVFLVSLAHLEILLRICRRNRCR